MKRGEGVQVVNEKWLSVVKKFERKGQTRRRKQGGSLISSGTAGKTFDMHTHILTNTKTFYWCKSACIFS